MVLAQEVCPLPSYVHSVENFPQPDTVEKVQAFLGLINLYRQFLPTIARTHRQLTNATEGEIRSNDRTRPFVHSCSRQCSHESAEQGDISSASCDWSNAGFGGGHHQFARGRPSAAKMISFEILGGADIFLKKAGECTSTHPSTGICWPAVNYIYRP
jgi:hypothetical protein